jgi:hypothetical protein
LDHRRGVNDAAARQKAIPFHENRVLVATGTALWAVTVGFCETFEKPTIDSGNESIVATPAIFIGGGELEKVMGHFHERVFINKEDECYEKTTIDCLDCFGDDSDHLFGSCR